MGKNIVEKIFEAHLVSGELKAGSPVGLKVDQVYTQDATGTMAWLQFEAMGLDRVKVPLAVSYIDHNMVQSDFMNPDDHLFLQTVAAKYGAYFSRPGNGICHQVHLEQFAAPGRIALGTDSHTPTGGGIGMIAIGVGGLDAATVMGGSPFEVNMPQVVKINLTGKLPRPYVTAMDVILEVLRRLTVKGGVGRIMEYGGPGVRDLNVTERATITNMGAELGATTSVFPSDKRTKFYLDAVGRPDAWVELSADKGAKYAEVIAVDLGQVEPMIAQPHSPDNVVTVRSLGGTKVNQVCIGSCTNSSYQAMKAVASVLKGNTVSEGVNLLVNPGSKQVYEMISREGLTADMIAAGARLLESSCGPCIGMGGAPGSGQVSVRSYNRNFKGRSGTKDASVFLASPVTCAVFAVKGEMVDPRDAGIEIKPFKEPKKYLVNRSSIIPPKDDTSGVRVIKGPNIREVSVKEPLCGVIEAEVLLKLGDNVTTDDIMPAGSKVLPFRSNIPAISEFVFSNLDKTFSARAAAARGQGGGIIVGGENYGQGSSREHAAIAPMFLGVQAVLVRSFARIHRSNLINFGILPLQFEKAEDYGKIESGDRLRLKDIISSMEGSQRYQVENMTKGYTFGVVSTLNEREREVVRKGGLLPYTREKAG
ncbi:MAG: aconitate hydratase [Nitrospiraceae bacterium]|nr:aconitate hydratase [Nitrospiraceae bacterium]